MIRIIERLGAWLAWQAALQELAKIVPYRTDKLEEVVGHVAIALELPRIFVAHRLRDRVRAGDDLRAAIGEVAAASDPAMVEPLGHMWAVWFPYEVLQERAADLVARAKDGLVEAMEAEARIRQGRRR